MKPPPPNRALKFLRWFCREDYIEEIEGDLTELFEKQQEDNPARAKRRFTWSVLRYFRPAFIKTFKSSYQTNTAAMFRHNFLITLRTFNRYRMSFFINLIGLSSGLICALLIYLWVNDELHVDKFHENDRQLFQVMKHYQEGDLQEVTESTSGLLAETLREEIPEIEFVVTAEESSNSVVLTVQDNSIRASGIYSSSDYFKLFSYGLNQKSGNTILLDENEIVISETIALKLFGTADSLLGKSIALNDKKELFISGIFKKVPSNSSIQFDFVLPYKSFLRNYPGTHAWGHNYFKTYLTLQEGTNITALNKKISKLYHAKIENTATDLFVSSYSHKYLFNKYENGIQAGGRITYVKLFSVIGILILMMACINFINLSTARASRRVKEVGLRKTFGASKISLIHEFLLEALLLSLLALLVSLVVVNLSLPIFNNFAEKNVALNFQPDLILFLIGIILFTVLASGLYPAFYLSGFKAVKIFKDSTSSSFGKFGLRKALVISQYALSILLIISVLVVSQQMEFISNQNLGYSKSNVLHFEREGKVAENMDTFLSELKNVPGVINASSTAWNFINSRASAGGISWEGKDPDAIVSFEVQQVNYDLIETLGITLKAGRTFSQEFSTDRSAIVFNEAAIKIMGIEDPIGKTVDVWGGDREIIGVVKDFHFESMYSTISPLFFIMNPSNCKKIMVKIAGENQKEVIDGIARLYHEFNPKYPLDYQFLDQDYQKQYEAEKRIGILSQYFAGIAILISCLGLLGLAAFITERRIKEIGIRKVNGAKVFEIIQMLNGDFVKWVITAFIIASPIAYYVTKTWLQNFSYKIELSVWTFVFAGCLSLAIALLTVSWQTYRAANMNPVDCLRDE